jgi:hypothetical protein
MVEKKSAFQIAWEAKQKARQDEIQHRRDYKKKLGGKLTSTPFALLLK